MADVYSQRILFMEEATTPGLDTFINQLVLVLASFTTIFLVDS
jgi:hypothetical protein